MDAWPELAGPAPEVAPRLLGAALTAHGVALRITEVEAYAGPDDPASHAFIGPTPRNAAMFGPPGHLYCYLSYGMHVCANVVVGPVGSGTGVLIRGAAVVSGLELARARRPAVTDDRVLARGPGNLGRVLGIAVADSGAPLDGSRPGFRLELGEPVTDHRRGPRVGVRRAADEPWRYWIPGEPSVSAYRRHPRAEVPRHPS